MARARTLKPGFFTNEDLVECPPLTRLLFAGLWGVADRLGRLEDRPKRLKMEILPADDCDVDAALNELEAHNLIVRYCVDGHHYIAITTFLEHQNPHPRETPSVIPAPPDNAKASLRQTLDMARQSQDHLTSLHPHHSPLEPETRESEVGQTSARGHKAAAPPSPAPESTPKAVPNGNGPKPKLTEALLTWGRENCPRLDREDLEQQYALMADDWRPPSNPRASPEERLRRWWMLAEVRRKGEGKPPINPDAWSNIATADDRLAHDRRLWETEQSERETINAARRRVGKPDLPEIGDFETWRENRERKHAG